MPNVPSCDEAVEGLPAALFEGTYRPQDRAIRSQRGEFVVQVFDQGEPAAPATRSPGQLLHRTHRGAYNGYTRGGYIERVATSRWSRRSSSPKLQPSITSTEGLDVVLESGSTTRTW